MSFVNHLLDQLHPDPSPQWLADLRQQLVTQLRDQTLPGRGVEQWRYTPLHALNGQSRAIELRPSSAAQSTISTEDLNGFVVADWPCHRMVFVNGHFAPRLSYLDELPVAVRFTNLAAAEVNVMDGLRSLIERPLGDSPADVLAVLNTAALADGAILEIAANCELERPLHCLFLTLPSDQPLACNVRNIIRVGRNANVHLVEQHIGLGDSDHVTNQFAQYELDQGAKLEQTRLQQSSDAAHLITRADVTIQSEACFNYCGLDLGGQLVRHDLNIDLIGENAKADLAGAWLLADRQHLDNHSEISHRVANCSSSEFFKGVVDDRAKAVFNGKVVVHPGADGTQAEQSNQNLLLSKLAEVDTKPELEIHADDVKCAHGATVGALDPDQLFYLRSRGVSEVQAQQLLTEAFCAEILAKTSDAALREFMLGLLRKKGGGS